MSSAENANNTVANAEVPEGSEPTKRYRAVVDEVCHGLHNLGVGARIYDEIDPLKFHLYVHPPYQPNRGNSMLRFFVDGPEVVISSETTTRLQSAQELETWVLDFLKLPASLESMRLFRETATKPVDACLYVSKKKAYNVGDLFVAIAPLDQQKLAESQPREKLEIGVEPMVFPGNGPFDANIHHQILESCGIKLRVLDESIVNGKIQLVLQRPKS